MQWYVGSPHEATKKIIKEGRPQKPKDERIMPRDKGANLVEKETRKQGSRKI
jgi:hypothetical protein